MAASASLPPAVAARGIVKHYGAIRALDEVSLDVRRGSVHGLLGENGAGKSTLVKILAGAVAPDAGEVVIGGREVALRSPADARRAGIAVVHQELSLFPALSVVSNVYAGNELKDRLGGVRFSAMRTALARTFAEIGWELPLDRPVGELALAEQQMVEIIRAIHFNAGLVLLDEPNSALTEAESQALFAAIRKLRARGHAFLLVSHRLDEVLAIADEITILRDGRRVHSAPAAALTVKDCVQFMVGTADIAARRPPEVPLGPVRLAVDHLRSGDLRELSLSVRRSEVVGVAGLEGAGVQALFEALFGTQPIEAGSLSIDGRTYAPRSPAQAIAAGVAAIPADRRTAGLLPARSIADNIVLVILRRLQSMLGYLREETLRGAARQFAGRFRIKAASLNAGVMTLSGGNQQKVVLAKWLAARPGVLLLNDPTRGIDVGAKAEVHAVVRELAAEGVAVLAWSSDAEELLAICHRIIVLRRGTLARELVAAESSRRDLLLAVAGGEAA
jgi:rhamnose transport system ATP-binding protein